MGYALPAGIGAKVAAPERQNIVVCGDGSFQMAMNELSAIRAADLDVKIVPVPEQHPGPGPPDSEVRPPYHGPFGVALDGSPDFSAVAGAYGIPSLTVDERGQGGRGAGPVPGYRPRLAACLIVKVHPDVGHQRLREGEEIL